MQKLTRTLVLPDVHVPVEHKPSVEAVLQFAKWFKPHEFIQLGDFCDFNSLSRYDLQYPGEFISMAEEVKAANQLLDKIEAVLPRDCRKYMVGGNHEHRYNKAKAKALFEKDKINKAVIQYKSSWAEEFNLHKRGNWQWCEYGKYLRIGKVIYTHGWGKGGVTSAQAMAKKFPGRNVIFGHTHRHLVYGQMDANDLPIETESIGTLSNFDLAYLINEPPDGWTRGFTYIYTRPDQTFTKNFVHIVNGKFIVNGNEYGRK